jgi:hypothetical protein
VVSKVLEISVGVDKPPSGVELTRGDPGVVEAVNEALPKLENGRIVEKDSIGIGTVVEGAPKLDENTMFEELKTGVEVALKVEDNATVDKDSMAAEAPSEAAPELEDRAIVEKDSICDRVLSVAALILEENATVEKDSAGIEDAPGVEDRAIVEKDSICDRALSVAALIPEENATVEKDSAGIEDTPRVEDEAIVEKDSICDRALSVAALILEENATVEKDSAGIEDAPRVEDDAIVEKDSIEVEAVSDAGPKLEDGRFDDAAELGKELDSNPLSPMLVVEALELVGMYDVDARDDDTNPSEETIEENWLLSELTKLGVDRREDSLLIEESPGEEDAALEELMIEEGTDEEPIDEVPIVEVPRLDVDGPWEEDAPDELKEDTPVNRLVMLGTLEETVEDSIAEEDEELLEDAETKKLVLALELDTPEDDAEGLPELSMELDREYDDTAIVELADWDEDALVDTETKKVVDELIWLELAVLKPAKDLSESDEDVRANDDEAGMVDVLGEIVDTTVFDWLRLELCEDTLEDCALAVLAERVKLGFNGLTGGAEQF